jgi:hypothetical protein
MKWAWIALAALLGVAATNASAQMLDLSGQFQCVQGCYGDVVGGPTFVSQNGTELRLVNEAGVTSRAWIDRPGHIWAQAWDEGADYSADGMVIHFENGTVWQRVGAVVAPPPPPGAIPVPVPGPAVGAIEPTLPATQAFDGRWNVVIFTQSGPCPTGVQSIVRISNGAVLAEDANSMVSVQGHVAPNGAVGVSVSAGSQQASAAGQLSLSTGSGTWQGQGNAGFCTGVWQATRSG